MSVKMMKKGNSFLMQDMEKKRMIKIEVVYIIKIRKMSG